MASLTTVERKILEDLLNMSSGYVLDFTNETFADFSETTVSTSRQSGSRKMVIRRQSACERFGGWKVDETVGQALEGLFDYINAIQPDSAGAVRDRHRAITNRIAW